jgi:hypothetical protein
MIVNIVTKARNEIHDFGDSIANDGRPATVLRLVEEIETRLAQTSLKGSPGKHGDLICTDAGRCLVAYRNDDGMISRVVRIIRLVCGAPMSTSLAIWRSPLLSSEWAPCELR